MQQVIDSEKRSRDFERRLRAKYGRRMPGTLSEQLQADLSDPEIKRQVGVEEGRRPSEAESRDLVTAMACEILEEMRAQLEHHQGHEYQPLQDPKVLRSELRTCAVSVFVLMRDGCTQGFSKLLYPRQATSWQNQGTTIILGS